MERRQRGRWDGLQDGPPGLHTLRGPGVLARGLRLAFQMVKLLRRGWSLVGPGLLSLACGCMGNSRLAAKGPCGRVGLWNPAQR